MRPLKKRLASINAKITTVQRLYGKDSNIYKRIISTINNAGGNTRFTLKMFDTDNLRELNKVHSALRAIESSKYLTKAGRKSIGDEARKTFLRNHQDVDDATASVLFDLFNNVIYRKVSEEFEGQSEKLIDEITSAIEKLSGENNLDIEKKIENALNNFLQNSGRSQKDIDYLTDELDRI